MLRVGPAPKRCRHGVARTSLRTSEPDFLSCSIVKLVCVKIWACALCSCARPSLLAAPCPVVAPCVPMVNTVAAPVWRIDMSLAVTAAPDCDLYARVPSFDGTRARSSSDHSERSSSRVSCHSRQLRAQSRTGWQRPCPRSYIAPSAGRLRSAGDRVLPILCPCFVVSGCIKRVAEWLCHVLGEGATRVPGRAGPRESLLSILNGTVLSVNMS